VTNGDSGEPAVSNGDSDEETPEQIRILRVRHFFEFDTSLILKRKEEITFYNEGAIRLDRIIYDAREFLPGLNIYDSNGELLIFHGNFQSESRSILIGSTLEESSEYPIIIEFPSTRPVDPNGFRVITLEYINDIGLKEGEIGFITLPIGVAPHFYLYFKKLDEYITEVFPFIESNEEQYFELDDLEETDFVQIEDTPSYFSISSSIAIPNCSLVIGTSYKLPPWNFLWFNGGIIIGIGAITTNAILLTSDVKTFLPAIIALGGISNTYLILTKGWVFTKNPVERILKIPYTSIYFWLILIIIFEIFIACCLAFIEPSNNQNLNITSLHQIVSNIHILTIRLHG
jgi:hypothetical protein